MPVVSVVVPCFNHAPFVEECLRSVVAQTYPALELVVSDDGSTDGSVEIVRRFVERDEIRHRFEGGGIRFEAAGRNAGAHVALNRGIELASGELVAICNSDDRFHPERIEVLASALVERSAALAFGAVRFIDRSGEDVTDTDWFALQLSQTQRSIEAYPTVGFALLRANVALSTGNLLFRRDHFQRVGGFRPLRYCHDWDFILRSVLVEEPLFERRFLYDYRLHEANSFRALQSVADEESQLVLRSFFSSVQREQYENRVVPGPRTWPVVFDQMMDLIGFWPHWQRARRSPA